MYTSFDDIHDLFVEQIDSYELANMHHDDVVEKLDRLLILSIPTLQDGMNVSVAINRQERRFEQKLSLVEEILMSKVMAIAWLKDKILSEELMRKEIGDRDYEAVQGNRIMLALLEAKSNLEKEVRRELINNGYSDKARSNSFIGYNNV